MYCHVASGLDIQYISAGEAHAVALTASGELYLWGMKVHFIDAPCMLYSQSRCAELDGALQS